MMRAISAATNLKGVALEGMVGFAFGPGKITPISGEVIRQHP
jgi:hypothetical protein